MIKVAITISFDLLHDGHIDHIEEASKLGDWLIVIVDPSDFLIKKKGYELIPLEARLRVAESIRYIDEVVVSIDKDGTCAETLRMLRPDVLAKGGDRTPDNMPQNEIDVCKDIGCKIVYEVGRKLNSSQILVKRAFNYLHEELK